MRQIRVLTVKPVYKDSLARIRPLLILGIIAGSLFTASFRSTSQDLLPELVRRIKPSAVAIQTFDNRGEALSRGSGFFIDADRVVTNRHVIESAYRAEIHSSSGAVYPVKGVLAVDAEGDLDIAAGRREYRRYRQSLWFGRERHQWHRFRSARHTNVRKNNSNHRSNLAGFKRQSSS